MLGKMSPGINRLVRFFKKRKTTGDPELHLFFSSRAYTLATESTLMQNTAALIQMYTIS